MPRWVYGLAGSLFITGIVMLVALESTSEQVAEIPATLETEPVPSTIDDSADDPAVWLHPQNPSLSAIIGTDKDSGLVVYDLSGELLQFLPDGKMNNVDIRYNFSLGGQRVALVTAGNRFDNSIGIYRVNVATRRLEPVAARKIVTCSAYGSCMYRSLKTGKYYYLVNSKPRGLVEQWELFDNGAGKVDARKVRTFEVGSSTEGCVADDELGYLYIGLQEEGIRKYGAEPNDDAAYTIVDRTGPDGHLSTQVEGLALYYAANGKGYLIASSQGSDEFVIYRREGNNEYVGTFTIVAGNGVDEVTHTDGIDVVNYNLGPSFPTGIFIAQDHENEGGGQNFKLVSWTSIANTMGLISVPNSYNAPASTTGLCAKK
ncbi:MAG: phytase [candidate division KSB1 bacterium]|nr:phytase [candidate division KSB1 bacterium]